MPLNYSPRELKPLYEKLPQDLKQALFSKESADAIYEICLKNDILDKNAELAKYIGYLMLGLLPPAEFAKTLQEELELNKDTAEKIYQQTARALFPPIKQSLEILYNTRIEIPTKPIEIIEEETPTLPSLEKEKRPAVKTKKPLSAPAKKPTEKDKYREPIE